MASKSKKRAPKPAPEDKDALSKSTYIDRRDERIAFYYFVRRVTKPPAIYDFLLHECRECLAPDLGSAHTDPENQHSFEPLVSANRASGVRIVQAVVMRLRQEAEPEEILALRRPIETEKVRKTLEYLLQKQIEVIEDNATVKVQKVSPSGEIVTVFEPRSPRLEKGKAIKAAMVLAEKIGKLTGAQLVADEGGEGEDKVLPGAGEKKSAESFVFAFPNVKGKQNDLDEMIAMNLDRGKVN